MVSTSVPHEWAIVAHSDDRPIVGAQVAIELLHQDGHRVDWGWADTDAEGMTVLVRPTTFDLTLGTQVVLCVAIATG